MRTLPKPAVTPEELLASCAAGITDPDLRARLETIRVDLIAMAATYDMCGHDARLHHMPVSQGNGPVTGKELRNIYTAQMSAPKGSARALYNAIRTAAPNDKCPLCGVGTVAVLDHHLPKSKYPYLAVCPYNLVPACDFCNNAKRAIYPLCDFEQTLHPYYDDYSKEPWIHAYINWMRQPALVFTANPPFSWSELMQRRAMHHFDVMKLAITYAANANDEMIPLVGYLAEIHRTKGALGVKDFLFDEAKRHSCRLNSWQYAMYRALFFDDRFVDGGFRHVAG